MIKFEEIVKTYRAPDGSVDALAGVSFAVDEGEFVAVCGPSGCGKSTLLMIAGALCAPTSGRVLIDGQDIMAMGSFDRAKFRAETIGFVFQMFHLLPYLTVFENVVIAAPPGRDTERCEYALELLKDFGLSNRLKHRPAELSAGERQRVAIARAMLNRPKLILADEPTGNLDQDSAKTVLELLSGFQVNGGTVLLVTHEPAAASYASRKIVLQNGLLAPE